MSLNSSSSSSSGGTPTATGIDAPMVGYRFHPTDCELIVHYLGPKVRGQDDSDPVIADVEVCKFEPWDLPVWSRIKSNDRVWYFVCPRQHKFKKSTRYNRKTRQGYWKPDGKVRLIRAKRTKEVIGSKRTLVFHLGRYKKGTRTKWVMHEYECTSNSGSSNQRDFVLCKLRKKSDEKDKRRDSYHQTALNPEVEGQELPEMANISSHGMSEPTHLTCSGSYNKNQDLCINGSLGELVDANSVKSSSMVDSNMGSLFVTNYLQISSQQSSQTPKTTPQTSNIQNFGSLPAIDTSPCHYQDNDITEITSFDLETQANANSKTYSKVLLGNFHNDANDGCFFVSPSESANLSGTMVDSTPDISKTDSLVVSNSENENLNDHDSIPSASVEVEWSPSMAASSADEYENSDILVPDGQLAFDLESKYEEPEGNSEFSAELLAFVDSMFEHDHMVKSPLLDAYSLR